MAALKKRTPLLPAIIYPPHLLLVPPPLVGVEVAIGVLAGFVASAVLGDGFRGEITLAVWPAIHGFFAICYLRDKHIWARWSGRFWSARPFRPGRPTPTLRPRRHRRITV